MPEEREQNSSYLTSLPLICINFVASILFAYFKMTQLAVLFMLLFVLGGVCYLWAKAAGKNLYCDFSYSKTGLFPGEELEIKLNIKNNKTLPVLWMSVQDCFTDEYTVPALLWHDETVITRQWTADKRGVKNLTKRNILTGDGFGLRQNFLNENVSGISSVAVYPKKVTVNPKMFMRNLWNASTGKNGSIEDVTVIKSTRDYQSSDAARYINWRVAARSLPLAVNVYDNIQPRGVHFILDGESFAQKQEALEETLSILASLLLALDEAGFKSGLSICAGSENEALTYSFDDSIYDMLYGLALYSPLPKEWDSANNEVIHESQFDEAAVLKLTETVGHFYYISLDSEVAAKSNILRQLSAESASLLTYEEGGELWLEKVSLRTLRI